MVVGVALHFTAVTSWATQSVVERPVSAASCTLCIVVCIIAIVVDHIVASAVSAVIVDIVFKIALANWFAMALILICCYGDENQGWPSSGLGLALVWSWYGLGLVWSWSGLGLVWVVFLPSCWLAIVNG